MEVLCLVDGRRQTTVRPISETLGAVCLTCVRGGVPVVGEYPVELERFNTLHQPTTLPFYIKRCLSPPSVQAVTPRVAELVKA